MHKQKAKMKQSKLLKESRGITLIALVITIIALLILAGISIAMLTGDNGILTQATRAKEETRGAAVQEEIDLWKINKTAGSLGGEVTSQTKEELLKDLKDQGLLTNDEYNDLNEGKELQIGSRIISIKEVKTVVQAFKDKEIEIGDYVNYTNPSEGKETVGKEETGYSKTQTYEVDSNTTWRVLGLDEEGDNLLLISGSPIKRSKEDEEKTDDPYLALGGAEGYYNCKSTLDKICSIYGNSLAEEARSIKIEDITYALGITIDKENNKAYKTNDPEKKAIPGYQGFFGDSYIYKSGDYAPENYLKATYLDKYTKLSDKKVNDSVDRTWYMIPYTQNEIVDETSQIYDVLFKGTTKEDNSAKSYWLASPRVNIDSNVNNKCAFFGPGAVNAGGAYAGGYGAFRSNGVWYVYELSVRPVISLISTVSVEDIKKVTGKSEAEWNSTPNSAVISGGSLTANQEGQVKEIEN